MSVFFLHLSHSLFMEWHSSSYFEFPASTLYIPDLTIKKTHKLSFSVCLNASLLYLTNSGMHTEKRWSSESTLLSKESGLTLRCEWRCALLSLTYILAPSFTIHKHHSSARCLMWKLRPHFLSTWENFGPNPCAAWLRWGGYFLYRVLCCKKPFWSRSEK